MVRYTLHVPLALNDGTPIPDEEIHGVEKRLLTLAGGFTRTEGLGGWLGEDGTIYREPMALFHVDDRGQNFGASMVDLARLVATAFQQEAVYLTTAPLAADLIRPVVSL